MQTLLMRLKSFGFGLTHSQLCSLCIRHTLDCMHAAVEHSLAAERTMHVPGALQGRRLVGSHALYTGISQDGPKGNHFQPAHTCEGLVSCSIRTHAATGMGKRLALGGQSSLDAWQELVGHQGVICEGLPLLGQGLSICWIVDQARGHIHTRCSGLRRQPAASDEGSRMVPRFSCDSQ